MLIVNILTDKELKTLYDYATELNLEVLVEVHDRNELNRAHQLSPKIIGVNNRDLKRFVTNVEHTNQILKFKRKDFIIFQKAVFIVLMMLSTFTVRYR